MAVTIYDKCWHRLHFRFLRSLLTGIYVKLDDVGFLSDKFLYLIDYRHHTLAMRTP